ncbi:pentapeptide repeat-containing protein [Rothia dentocariosa]|uniref:pentapeptide repeat-containing protein n=1 Tax=Rothia dentocariosa TaxID=2047 RepID=UPI00352E5F37
MVEKPRNNEETNATTSVGKTENFVSKHFVRLLVWLAVSGGALAIFGPWLLYVTGLTGETDANLRLHILYVTGGTIAVLGLVETHRKNTTDRIKADADIQNYQASQSYQSKTLDEQARQFTENIAKEREKIEADKAKNEQDHIRQVHAERRSRYTTAIEQLSNDKASIRLGGVYTLVGLVDEWLTDEKTIPDIKERRKEGQVIINNLCAYIRSPFLLAERTEQLDKPYAKDLQKDFAGDKDKFDADKRFFAQEKAALEEERQIRQSIIKEMREHLHNYEELVPWSCFDYDFSNTVFFYLTDLSDSLFGASSNFTQATFTRGANFSEAKFTEDADFNEAKFTEDANFSKTTFTEDANFSEAKFTRGANFSEAKFTRGANFSEAKFTRAIFFGVIFTRYAGFFGTTFTIANFSGVAFTEDANFSKTTFTEDANFSEVTFTKDARFSGAAFTKVRFYGVKFTGYADFSRAKFTEDVNFFTVTFPQDADFSGAAFTQNADFSGAVFTKDARFSGAAFTQNADFSAAVFTKDARFSGAAFTQNADFSAAVFTKDARFSEAAFTQNADFSEAAFTQNADFSEATFKEKPIFEYALDIKTNKARFSHKAEPEDYNFEVSYDSPYKIETEEQEHNGVKFIIPKDTELFDPDDPSN